MTNPTISVLLYLWLFWRCIYFCNAHRCQSCFTGCQNFDDCDCDGDGDQYSICEGAFCYAKLEYFTDDGVSAVQKGCLNRAPSSFLGCQYASDERSIACYCTGDLCNSAKNLSVYNEAPKLPLVNCCECNDDETGDERCFPQNCTRNCTGNYCYLDLVANAQGCGWGHPQLFHFLRTQNYTRWSKDLTCAEYYDNYRNYMSGCTCSTDFCNFVHDLDQVKARQQNQLQKNKAHFCYALYSQSESAFGKDIYRQATLCQSHFCFVSWTSVEVVFDPDEQNEDYIGEEVGSGDDEQTHAIRKRQFIEYGKRKKGILPSLQFAYEISAGCLFVDDEEKVQTGCTTEWSQTEHAPLTKHCICSEKLCNDFHLIENVDVSLLAPAPEEVKPELAVPTIDEPITTSMNPPLIDSELYEITSSEEEEEDENEEYEMEDSAGNQPDAIETPTAVTSAFGIVRTTERTNFFSDFGIAKTTEKSVEDGTNFFNRVPSTENIEPEQTRPINENAWDSKSIDDTVTDDENEKGSANQRNENTGRTSYVNGSIGNIKLKLHTWLFLVGVCTSVIVAYTAV